MAEAAVTFLLETVSQQVKESYNLISGAKKELGWLIYDLQTMKNFLLDAAKVPDKSNDLKTLESRIRGVVYDVEDTIDTCLTHTAAANEKNFFRKIFSNSKRFVLAKEVKSHRDDDVKKILDRITTIGPLRKGEGFGTSVRGRGNQVKQGDLTKQVDEVIVLEDVENKLIDDLKKQTSEVDVISIVGLSGKGKTTLARRIYQNNPSIRDEFRIRIWVDVSQEFNIKEVLLKILKEFPHEDMSGVDDNDALAQTVRDCLQIQKVLLVIDGVSTIEDWDSIHQVVRKSHQQSKVLITTRERTIGASAGQPHLLRDLNADESWKLLQLKVFGKLGECPKPLEDIGKRIATHYRGLPQEILRVGVVLRGLLSKRPEMAYADKKAWQKVSEDLNVNAANSSVELSYNRLPDGLKNCFLYLGVFPIGYKIPVSTLTKLWIAEGFIQNEEAAMKNLDELMDKDLVVAGETCFDGSIKTCHVPNVIRDFCIFRAKTELLFQEIRKHDGVFHPQVSGITDCRRLCIHAHLLEFLGQLVFQNVKDQVPKVRSFLCFYEQSFALDPKYLSTIPDAFPLLRVLDWNCVKLAEFPINITKLIHLRYITLSCDNLKVLHGNVSELWNLQTLVIDTKSPTLEIKANIWKMVQLSHLKTKAEIIILGPKKASSRCEKLQTLSRLSPTCCTEDILKRACNLKKLGISGCLADLDLNFNFLKELGCLDNLKLVNAPLYGTASEKPLQGFPSRYCFKSEIKRLTLSATHLEWGRHMSELAAIDTLEVLKLKNYAFKGDSWRVEGSGFLSLEFLLIDTTDLDIWKASEYQFPILKCLVIKNCEKLSEIPLGLAKTLHKLEIKNARSAVKSAKEIEKKSKEVPQEQKTIWSQAPAPLILNVSDQ